MLSLISPHKAQRKLVDYTRQRRLQLEWTQAELSRRSGVPLATLRKFEQKGVISLHAFLSLYTVLGGVDKLLEAAKPGEPEFKTIQDVIRANRASKPRQRGRRS